MAGSLGTSFAETGEVKKKNNRTNKQINKNRRKRRKAIYKLSGDPQGSNSKVKQVGPER